MGDEDEWQLVSNKRSKKRKLPQIDEDLQALKRLKTSTEGDTGNAFLSASSPSFELLTKKKKKNQRDPPEAISTKDLQQLVFWIYNMGPNPAWIFLKNKSLFKKVVLLAVGGFTMDIWNKYQSLLPNCQRIFQQNQRLTLAPGSKYRVYSPLQALLSKSDSKQKKGSQKALPEENPTKPSFFVHSIAELYQNGYPFIAKSVAEEGSTDVNVQYSPWEGFISFSKRTTSEHELLAIDCEMCRTLDGLELTRISVVDEECNVIYDTFVKPEREIVDYLTCYSGITKAILDPITTTLKDVHEHLSKLISEDTILVGHSFENDLKALKICHSKVIDTSILFPHAIGPGKQSLKSLVFQHLNRVIQTGSHDSIQDAVAAMQLLKLKLQYGPNFGVKQDNGSSILSILEKANISVQMLDRANILGNYHPDGIVCQSDEEVVGKFSEVLKETDKSQFIFSQLQEFICYLKSVSSSSNKAKVPSTETVESEEEDQKPKQRTIGTLEETLKEIDDRILKIYDDLPENSFLVVTSGQVHLNDISRLLSEKKENESTWNGLQDQELESAVTKGREGITLFALKAAKSDQ